MADDYQETHVAQLRGRVNNDGIQSLKTENGLKDFMGVTIKFPYYSFDDISLLALQCKDATFLEPYKTFLYKFNRQVKGNEKAIHLISYAPDYDTVPELARDENGDLISPEYGSKNNSLRYEISETVKWRDSKFFDISQTIGDEIPNLVASQNMRPENSEELNEILKKVSPVPVHIEDFSNRRGLVGGRDWAYDPENKCIYIKDFLSPENMSKALISGISRASAPEASSFENDMAAYCICERFGVDTEHLNFMFENLDEKIDSRIKTRSGADTLEEFKKNIEDNVIHTVSDVINGTVSEMALRHERESMNYDKEAEVLGVPALYTSRIMTPQEVPAGMYGYKVIGSHFNEKTEQVGGPFCLTALNNNEADTNQGGTVIVPSYIALNESGFLRLGENDLVLADIGPLKDTLERLSHTDLQDILQNRIIQSNEEIMWTDHGSRFALYHVNDNVPYKGMPFYEIGKNGYEISGKDYHMVYGARMNEKTLAEFMSRFEAGSEERPVDFNGRDISVGDVLGINQYGRTTYCMVDFDGKLVNLPHFAEERYAEMFKNGTNASLESYSENGGLKDRWTVEDHNNWKSVNFCIYTQKAENGDLNCKARIISEDEAGNKHAWGRNYGTEKIPDRNTVMGEFDNFMSSKGQERTAAESQKAEKPEHRERSKEKDRSRERSQEKTNSIGDMLNMEDKKIKEREPSIFGPSFSQRTR